MFGMNKESVALVLSHLSGFSSSSLMSSSSGGAETALPCGGCGKAAANNFW
jgi:hypothetical protein